MGGGFEADLLVEERDGSATEGDGAGGLWPDLRRSTEHVACG